VCSGEINRVIGGGDTFAGVLGWLRPLPDRVNLSPRTFWDVNVSGSTTTKDGSDCCVGSSVRLLLRAPVGLSAAACGEVRGTSAPVEFIASWLPLLSCGCETTITKLDLRDELRVDLVERT
jgi:hypothetical protein